MKWTTLFLCFNTLLFAYPDLNEFIRSNGDQVMEGHLEPNSLQWKFFAQFLKDHPEISNIAEVGFNAGHSSLLFLSALPHPTVVSFDIGYWSYLKWGKKYMDQYFPQRHLLILGDSHQSVPLFHQIHPETVFDLIFIDGGHTYQCAMGDILNFRQLSNSTTWVIVDDINYGDVSRAWEDCKKAGLVEEIQRAQDPGLNRGWVVGRYKH